MKENLEHDAGFQAAFLAFKSLLLSYLRTCRKVDRQL